MIRQSNEVTLGKVGEHEVEIFVIKVDTTGYVCQKKKKKDNVVVATQVK